MGVAIPLGYVEDRASGALVVDGSLRFDSSKSHYLSRTPSSSGNTKTFTISAWVKRNKLNYGYYQAIYSGDSASSDTFCFNSSTDAIRSFVNGAGSGDITTSALFRDVSAWMHVCFSVDTTQASNQIKVYVNGVQQSVSGTQPSQNYVFTKANVASVLQYIGIVSSNDKSDFNLSQYYFIDGQALDASYFGYTDALTNTWRPKKFKPAATPNDGTTWSSAGNFSGNVRSQGDSYGPPKMFNGIIGNESTTGAVCFAPYSSDSTCTWTSPTTFTGLTSLRLYVDLSGTTGKLTVNGVDYSSLVTALSGGDGWITIPQSSLSTISFGYTGGVNSATGIAAVEVNGVTLLDSDTTNIGTNGFYLPFDGSAPIGQDQSGRGNNWTPVNFGGSNTLEKATGALPILNTDGGGKVARVGVRTDSSASSLVLALPLVGIKSDFSNAVNSGTSNKAITANGNAAASSVQSNFYGGSFYFDGTGDWLSIGTSSDFSIGTSDNFTFEAFIYPTSVSDTTPFGIGNNAGFAYRIISGSPYLYIGAVGGILNTGTISANKWTHITITRNNGTLYSFIDGVLVGSVANTSSFNGTQENYVGAANLTGAGSPGYTFTGYIQDVRIYKGLAKYTQNFIPASTDPDILPDTPSGVSYTSNLTQITDGAVAFDGSGDYLSLPNDDTNFRLTGDFTIEIFVYAPTISASSGYAYVIDYAANGSDGWGITFYNNQLFAFFDYGANGPNAWGPSSSTQLNANQWYHIAWTRQSNVHYYYINGKKYTGATQSFSAPSSSSSNVLNIGRFINNSSYFTGLISNIHVVNGTAIYTTDFTPPTGPISSVANTKLLCCKSNSSATAFDVSPGTITANGNAAATNFNPFTANINTQRGKQSGWCTWNPLEPTVGTLSNGNLLMVGSSAWKSTKGTVSVSSGKWYYEGVVQGNTYGTTTGNLGGGIGWYTTKNLSFNVDASTSSLYANLLGFHNTGQYNNFSTIQTSTGSMTAGDVIGVALNKDSNTFAFYKNGVSIVSGSLANTTDDLTPWTNAYYSSDSTWVCNFGQKPFKFPPPAGFQPLALANTPRPTIVRPDQFVGVTTYSGDGTTGARAINVGFKPDFVWIKGRNTAYSHLLYDTVRGIGPLKGLNSNETRAEGATVGDDATYGYLSSFNNNGFSVIKGSDATSYTNGGSSNYVAWAWKAGGNSNTYNINDVGYATASAAGLTAGTITPTGASVNTKSGFSIITYNGAGTNSALTNTISHGLTQAPTFMIVKARTGTNAADDWFVYHKSIGPTKRIRLNLTNAADTQTWMGDTEPTSSLITLNQGWYSVNYTGHTHILYAWHDVPGFSKFGSHTGTSGQNFISLGFEPELVIIKNSSSSSYPTYTGWAIFDSERTPYNAVSNALFANKSQVENLRGNGGPVTVADFSLDLLSNGFCLRDNGASEINLSGNTYIYAAWAKAPTQNLYGAQANAR